MALHNLEEALTIPGWLPRHLPAPEARFGIRPLASDSTAGVLGALLVAVVLYVPALPALLGLYTPGRS